jgi:hypothetical protein
MKDMMLKGLLILIFAVIGIVGYASTGVTDEDIRAEFDVKNVTDFSDYNNADKWEDYVSPFVRDINKKHMRPDSVKDREVILDFYATKYPFITGEYPYMLKDLEGILVTGDNLSLRDTRVSSRLTGDGWDWNHQGGKEVAGGIYFDMQKIYPIYTDPTGLTYAEDLGFDVENGFVYLTSCFHKPAPLSVTFFTKKDKV